RAWFSWSAHSSARGMHVTIMRNGSWTPSGALEPAIEYSPFERVCVDAQGLQFAVVGAINTATNFAMIVNLPQFLILRPSPRRSDANSETAWSDRALPHRHRRARPCRPNHSSARVQTNSRARNCRGMRPTRTTRSFHVSAILLNSRDVGRDEARHSRGVDAAKFAFLRCEAGPRKRLPCAV